MLEFATPASSSLPFGFLLIAQLHLVTTVFDSGTTTVSALCVCASSFERILADTQDNKFLGGQVSRQGQRANAATAAAIRQQQQRRQGVVERRLARSMNFTRAHGRCPFGP
jgi:hypothetical protein